MVITGNIPGVTSGGGWVCSMSRGDGYVHGMGGVYPELHGYVWGVGYHRTWDTSPRPTDTDTWLVADARFPRDGGTRPGGGQKTILPNFPKNCMKLTEFGNPGGAGVPRAPFRSATAGGGHQNMYSWQASAMYPTGMLSCYRLQ